MRPFGRVDVPRTPKAAPPGDAPVASEGNRGRSVSLYWEVSGEGLTLLPIGGQGYQPSSTLNPKWLFKSRRGRWALDGILSLLLVCFVFFIWQVSLRQETMGQTISTPLCLTTRHWSEPTWDDCQQLLQTLFTTEERERILMEARKNVPGDNGLPTTLPNLIDLAFPLSRPDWDYSQPKGRERLQVYRQALVAGLKGAARRPTNLTKVREVLQKPEEPPSVFLERLMEAFRRYTPFDPTSEGQRASVTMAFIGQAAPDIRKKLQRLEGLQDRTLQDLVKEAEKVYHRRETDEEKEQKREKIREKNLTRILAAVVDGKNFERDRQAGNLSNQRGPRSPLGKNQCAYCKEQGHWVKDCPKKKNQNKILSLAEDSI
ncbi:uncharacterized protein LOC123796608 [Ursus americanus]|uniref:uncharacterized protein LOC123796608 n=1 Tax=Ursus americanus TaxID=9643 RepID=UPI001E67994B|nr:uncharacterized protein LOC123796608 [Ursus americanus]